MNQHIIVTGASRGIGKAIAEYFVRKGEHVIGIARTEDALNQLALVLGERFTPYPGDLGTSSQASKVMSAILKENQVKGLILNSGLSIPGNYLDSKPTEWKRQIDTNYLAPAAMLQKMIAYLRKKKDGKIIAISSLAAVLPFPENAAYAASKAAFYHLIKTAAIESNDHGIAFGAVLPGLTDTKMTENMASILPKASPKSVSRAVWKCWQRPDLFSVVNRSNQLAEFLYRMNPPVFSRLVKMSKNVLPRFKEALD
ncbi:MAG: SDR family oxidoreductase [Oligoflexales bacterium]|nr:SDR family oxidoreductase [Oligoflexales bacterium]